MASHTGLVLLRELQPLCQARDQVVREQSGGRQGADGEPTGAKGEAMMGWSVWRGSRANLVT
jgi:hypothetical protein